MDSGKRKDGILEWLLFCIICVSIVRFRKGPACIAPKDGESPSIKVPLVQISPIRIFTLTLIGV